MSETNLSKNLRGVKRKKSRRLRKNSLNQKLRKNLNNIIKEIYNLGKLTELPSELYIKALKVEPKDRSMRDLQYIKYFLDHSKLADKFKLDNFKKESLDQIFTQCAAQLKYFHLEKDKILFRIGDEPDNFYLIINGRIGILKPISNHKEMTGLEYFYYIYQLKKQNEIYILKKTIEKNNSIFKFEYQDKIIFQLI